MKKNPLLKLDAAATCLPWWAWLLLASLSYLLLEWIAGIEIKTGSIVNPQELIWPMCIGFIKGAAIGLKTLLPCLLAAAGIYEGIQRLCENF